MPHFKNKGCLIKELSAKLLDALHTGDLVIKGGALYFESHLSVERKTAIDIYEVFKTWALKQNPPEDISDRNFFRVLFSTIARMKARRQIVIKVAADSAVVLLLAQNQV
jgi:hypothetical protein